MPSRFIADRVTMSNKDLPKTEAVSLEELKGIIEALVFASPEPLTPTMLYKLLGNN